MRTITFERIKTNAIHEFVNRMGGSGEQIGVDSVLFLALVAAACQPRPDPPRKVLEEWIDFGTQLIHRWDVRSVRTLIELFPSAAPKGWLKVQLGVAQDEKDRWVIYPV